MKIGFDETKNYGISFCKNYLGICLSGAVIILALSAFPSLLSGFSGGEITGIKGEMWGSLCAVLASRRQDLRGFAETRCRPRYVSGVRD